jgi:undecaprenyl pyrophosphate phosphatase UppP
MLGDYFARASSTPSWFFVIPTCWENCFSSRRYSTYFLSSFSFLIIIPVILAATMLGYYSMSVSLMPSDFFIVVSIYWKSASYRSSLDLTLFGKTTNRSPAKLICSFFLLTDMHVI